MNIFSKNSVEELRRKVFYKKNALRIIATISNSLYSERKSHFIYYLLYQLCLLTLFVMFSCNYFRLCRETLESERTEKGNTIEELHNRMRTNVDTIQQLHKQVRHFNSSCGHNFITPHIFYETYHLLLSCSSQGLPSRL